MNFYMVAAALGAVALFIMWNRRDKVGAGAGDLDQVTEDYQKRDPEDALEDALDQAWNIWPYVARQATTWAAVAGLIASIAMNAKFSQIIGVEIAVGLIIWAMFSMFDVAVPFVTVATDSNPDGKDTDPRPWYFYFVVAVSVSTSLLVGWTSLGSIGTRANVKSEVHNARVLILQNEIKRTSHLISNSEALETSESYMRKAATMDNNALTEKRNKYCGKKCRGWKFKAEEQRGLAASAKAKEDAMAAREAAQIELDSKTDEAVLTNGIGIMAKKFGYEDDKFILLSGLMLMITALITVMPFLWIFAFDGAQKARTAVMQRVRRKVYRRALTMPGGPAWLSQKFSPDELVIMKTDPTLQAEQDAKTSASVSALSAKLDEMRVAESSVHTTNIIQQPAALNQDAVNRIIHVLDALPTNQQIESGSLYEYYLQAGGRLPRSSYNQHLAQALSARLNVHVDEQMNVTVAA